ncbi:stalk domain-containing protein [Paenibacillus mendelii]|uniref:Stalk domain-containing protein n=1 Tax=Paenibacillus mendelii TaxID=206163 RepID=A0ABV6J4U2_9BACL|nr:stalk domain-containing protein [Paenibacillus mendelii]MCQ6562754.1 copper amine oxidase N-terminal domain-containing protein [Paenibacillus mendelii]
MKSLKWLLILSLLAAPVGAIGAKEAAAQGAGNQLTLKLNSKVMIKNGVSSMSAQPVTAKNGTSFIPLKSVADQYGYNVSFDAKTKESVVKNALHEFRFKADRKTITRDGQPVQAPLAPFALKGSMMVPIRTWSNMTDSQLNLTGTTITLAWGTKPTADFEVTPTKIYAGETIVTYTDRSTNQTGQPFMNEQWTGKEEIFSEAGIHTITRQVQDVTGEWSAPFSVSVEVLPPNQPPVADFKMEREIYRIGEKIIFTDLSTDDENAIGKTKYTGRPEGDAFFEAGEKSVTLEVTDSHGLTSSVTKTITVTEEVLYTKEEYGRLFTNVGDKFTVNGSAVLQYQAIKYAIQSDTAQLVRSNSPETLISEGIVYEDQLTGNVRFLFHNYNQIGYPVRMYLLATNKGNTTVNVNTSTFGIGGPDAYVENTGKLSVVRYLQSLQNNPSPSWTTIKPGQTIELLPELSKMPIKANQIYSAYADLYSDQELVYDVVVVAADKDPKTALPTLSVMPRDGKHVRGTFDNANRMIEIVEPLGYEENRMTFGDGTMDSFLYGYDSSSGVNELNVGNFGVMYTMKLDHVAPNTVIALNPRGGVYTGAFLVNGQLVTVTNKHVLLNNNEAAVLYRTGSTEESVEIKFTLASGSFLPLAMLFLPLPEVRN